MQTNRLLPQFAQWASLYLSEQMGQVGLHHNFKLLLTQIFCRRLNLEQGIVSLEVGLSYDLLRFIPCSTICSHPFQYLLHWGIILFVFAVFGLIKKGISMSLSLCVFRVKNTLTLIYQVSDFLPFQCVRCLISYSFDCTYL